MTLKPRPGMNVRSAINRSETITEMTIVTSGIIARSGER